MTKKHAYEVDIPNQGTFRVESDTELTDSQVIEQAQGQITAIAPTIEVGGQSLTPTEEPAGMSTMDQIKGGGRAVAQGMLFNLADELEAALRTGSITNDEYKKVRDQIRAENKQFALENPGLATGLEIAGAFTTPFLGGAKAFGMLPGGKAAIEAMRTGTTGQRIAGASYAGGASGVATGVGVAPELQDIPGYATGYGAGGAIAGPIVGEGLKLSGSVLKNATERVGLGNVNKRATDVLATNLSRDNLTPAQVKETLDEYRRLGVDNATIADLGKNLQDLGYQAYVIPSAGKGTVKEFLEGRTTDIPEEMVQGLIDKAKVQSDTFGYDYLKTLTDRQRTMARAAYPESDSKKLVAKPFQKYFTRDLFQDAYKRAQKRADVYGEKLPPLEQIMASDEIPTNVLHEIKIGLDRVIESETDKLTGKMTSYGGDVSAIKKEFNDLIKSKNPQYALANKEFADEAKIQEAYNFGLRYNKLTTEEFQAKAKDFNLAEKEAFRVGLVSNVKESYSKFTGGDFERKIFGSPKQKTALRMAFDNQDDYNAFVDQLAKQKTLRETSARVLGGSRTHENIATEESISPQVFTDIAQGNFGRAVQNAGARVLAESKYSPRMAEQLKGILFEAEPSKQQQLLNAVEEAYRRGQKPKVPTGMAPYLTGRIPGILGE